MTWHGMRQRAMRWVGLGWVRRAPPTPPGEAGETARPVRTVITMRDPLGFFLPLIFTAELMMISHSIIHAFLARLDNPTVTLAAFSVAFVLHGTVGSPIWTGPQIAISFISDKRSMARLYVLHLQALVVPTALMLAFSLTPLGDWLYGAVMGGSAEVVEQAKWATLAMTMVFVVVPFRNISAALIMVKRRTPLITLATAVRLLSLGGFLYVLPLWFTGATVGAMAVWMCIAVESVVSVLFCLGFYRDLPDQRGDPAPYGEMWRFAWPLMINQITESAVFLAINLFLGRLAQPDLALAAFGVLRGILMVLLSPLRNLAQTAQTLTRTREDARVMMRFSLWIVVIFSVAVLAISLTPLSDWVLFSVMGLTPELGGYAAPALPFSALVAVCWGYSAVFKGLITAIKRTGALAVAGGLRLVVVLAIGSVTLLDPNINGAVVGILAFAGAFAAEAVLLGWRLFFGKHAGSHFPPLETAAAAEG